MPNPKVRHAASTYCYFIKKALRTNGPTNGQTDERTDKASYRDARTHLKRLEAAASGQIITID